MMAETRAQRGPRLVGLGELAPREHPLGALDVAVGSDRENDLVLAHPTVSRRHAVLGYHAGNYTVADLQSTNGTFVNGRRIRQPVELRPGDEVAFGAAKFTMVSGTTAVGAPVKSRAQNRMLGAVAGIIAFALIGFIVTRYALSFGHRAAIPTAMASAKPASAPTAVALEEPAATSEPSPEAAPEAETYAPLWLRRLNDFRASAGLAPVSSDSRLSDGDRKHATYIMKNFATQMLTGELGAEAHTEEPSRPFYTPEGAEAARTSDVAERGGGKGPVPDPQGWAITGWVVAPFHRLFILSPLLRDVGFGADCDEHNCVALLNVLSGSDPLPRYPRPLAHPVFYPPDGGTIPPDMGELSTEWPTPISGCDGYAFPVGIPLTVQLGPMVDAELDSFSFSREDGTQLPACGFDANSYRNGDEDERRRVVSNLRGQGAIVIVPRAPLLPGFHYDALVTVNGSDYKWSFDVVAKASSGQPEGGNR
jgi:hypothetical protein